jgi:hypothetical protein
MLRLLIKLAIAALFINAAFRVGTTYWRFYQFEDALQELAQFGETRPDKQLCAQAVEKAALLEVPITADALLIRRGSNPPFNCETGYQGAVPSTAVQAAKIFIEGNYKESLKLVPGYTYVWTFQPSVSAWVRP